MSFWPLPTILVEALLAARESGPVVELGSGDGEFTGRLRSLGIRVLGVDRRRPAPGTCDIVNADLECLPFRRGSVAAFVLANTLRHVPPARWPRVAEQAHAAARAGGVAVVLEDQPHGESRAEKNYRRALQLLASFDPERGHPLGPEEFLPAWGRRWGEPAARGDAENAELVRDPMAPIRWMQARRPDGETARQLETLAAGVLEHGMSYGRFWFCVFRKAATSP